LVNEKAGFNDISLKVTDEKAGFRKKTGLNLFKPIKI
jgi:hypothetical protein